MSVTPEELSSYVLVMRDTTWSWPGREHLSPFHMHDQLVTSRVPRGCMSPLPILGIIVICERP
jgi:hypothetical protein